MQPVRCVAFCRSGVGSRGASCVEDNAGMEMETQAKKRRMGMRAHNVPVAIAHGGMARNIQLAGASGSC